MKVIKKCDIMRGICDTCGAIVECLWDETKQLYDCEDEKVGRGINCPTCKELIEVKRFRHGVI